LKGGEIGLLLTRGEGRGGRNSVLSCFREGPHRDERAAIGSLLVRQRKEEGGERRRHLQFLPRRSRGEHAFRSEKKREEGGEYSSSRRHQFPLSKGRKQKERKNWKSRRKERGVPFLLWSPRRRRKKEGFGNTFRFDGKRKK